MDLRKPSDMFDREWEWSQLVRFISDEQPGATLGIVSGRRRQGKTFLLEAASEATGGFYYGAIEALPRHEALRQLGLAVTEYTRSPGTISFHSWEEAIDALLALAVDEAKPIVIDEFPYLAREAPELPSVIQKALAPRRPERRRSKARLLLCGSSVSFMGSLLTGSAPLRGRAALELVIPTFDFRLAAEFWKIKDYVLAALMYCVVGGTPAYRTEYLRGVGPKSLKGFDAWVVEHVLSPASPLFREVRALLAEDPNLRETGLYHTVLAAVAEGNSTRGGIASRIERKASDISHHLTVLEDAGLLTAEPEAFRRNRSSYRIVEPLVLFYHSIMRLRWTQLERVRPGRTARIWRNSQPTFRSKVAGPVFERMCQVWAEDMTSEETFRGEPARVRSGVVSDPAARQSYEVDVAVFDHEEKLLTIGEVKWGDVVGMGHLQRLQHVADVLETQGKRPGVLCLYSGKGFMPALVEEAAKSRGTIQLVDLERLYEGE